MEKGYNVYRGLDTDTSYDSIGEGFYVDALNMRLSNVKGESIGSITNIKGNSAFFDIPNNDGGLTVVGTKTIIGATNIRDKIVLMVADDSDKNGWIYELTYSDTRQEFIGLELKYENADLNFSKKNPIEIVGRYESDNVRRIYWSDYFENFRAVNLEDPDLMGTPIGLVDTFIDIKFTQPLVTSIFSGGNLKTGLNQYAYRLKTKKGKQTLVSLPSNMVHIVSSFENQGPSVYSGDPKGTNTNRAVEVTIDTSGYDNYDSIELLVAIFEDIDQTPSVFSVETKDLDDTGSIKFVHTGFENSLVPIELFEFTLKQFPFSTCKTLVAKDNSLVVANIKESQFDIKELLERLGETFEAKTKRFDRTGNEDASLNHSDPEITLLNKAFNTSYNLDAHWDSDWHVNKQFKYKSDGVTLGGQGPNISYKFHLEPFFIDGDVSPRTHNLAPIAVNAVNLNDGYGNYPKTGFFNPVSDSMSSPFKSGLIRGYKRGETYRFGIVFYNKKGEPSFVELIGDIKFPDISEEDGSNNASDTNYFPTTRETLRNIPGNQILTTAYAMGIEFDIDFSTCPNFLNEIESYQIVRVKRESADSRRLCSGVYRVMGDLPVARDEDADNPDKFNMKGPGDSLNVLHLFSHHNQFQFSSSVLGYGANANFARLNNNLTKGASRNPFDVRGEFCSFYSPELSFNYRDTVNNIPAGNACLLMTGRYYQYFSSAPGEELPMTEPVNNNGKDHYSFFSTPESGKVTTGTEDLGLVFDFRKKPRTVRKVEKVLPDEFLGYDTFERGVEYIKKWKDLEYINFNRNRLGDDEEIRQADFNFQKSNGLRLFSGYEENTAKNFYLRNFNVYLNNDVADLHRTKIFNVSDPALIGIAKGGTCITGALEKIDSDLITGAPLSKKSSKHYFNSYPGESASSAEFGVTSSHPSGEPVNMHFHNLRSTPIFDILLPKQEVYGGFGKSALENNTFIGASPIISKEFTKPKVFGGDIFISMFMLQTMTAYLDRSHYRGDGGFNDSDGANYNMTETMIIGIESKLNVELNYGANVTSGVLKAVLGGDGGIRHIIYRQETDNSESTHGKSLKMYEDTYNEVYSKEADSIATFVKPDALQNSSNIVNDIRAYISNVKFNNENEDSWTKFGINNFYDADDYGPINRVISHRDEVMFFQDRAVGKYLINPRAIISTEDGIPTELGSGEGLQDHQYLTNNSGSIHQWAINNSSSAVYYWDGINRTINMIGGEGINPISASKKVNSFVNSFRGNFSLRKENGGDNPILRKGVLISHDAENNEILTTFHGINNEDESVTLAYDEMFQQFSSRYTFTPPFYIDNKDIFLSTSPLDNSKIYKHNVGNWGEFYDTVEESSIKLVLNANADLNKILRTIEFNSIVRDDNKVIDRFQTITGFSINTEYQASGKIPFDASRVKRKFDKWRIKIPRDQESNGRNRFRSSHFMLTLYFDNTYNKELVLNRILYYYDIQTF